MAVKVTYDRCRSEAHLFVAVMPPCFPLQVVIFFAVVKISLTPNQKKV